MKDYKLKLRNLHVSHTLGWSGLSEVLGKTALRLGGSRTRFSKKFFVNFREHRGLCNGSEIEGSRETPKIEKMESFRGPQRG